jgi:hypothetical protein
VLAVKVRIDEHTTTIRVDDSMRAWSALGSVLASSHVPGFGGSRVPGFMRSIRDNGRVILLMRVRRCPALSSFEPSRPGLALEGQHRFSSYALVFRLAADEHRTTLGAETRAAFLGFGGRVYRTLVTGTRGHVQVVRGLLRATRKTR